MIIGGAGLLGTHLASLLSAGGYQVALCDNLTGNVRHRLPADLPFFSASVVNITSLQHAVRSFSPDIIVMATAHVPPPDTIYNFYHDTTLTLGGANTLCSVLSSSVSHVIFCSSSEVYDAPGSKRLLRESKNIDLSATHNGVAKLAAEELLRFRCQELGISYTVARIFDVYGPRVRFSARSGVVNFIIDSFLRGDVIGVAGGDKYRDFLHIKTAAWMVEQLIVGGFEGVFNIGSGQPLTLRQMVYKLMEVMGVEHRPYFLPRSRNPTFSAVADVSKFHSVVGKPKTLIPLGEGLVGLVEYRKKELAFKDKSDPSAILSSMRGM